MRIQGPDGKWFVGPFETERDAEAFEERIGRMLEGALRFVVSAAEEMAAENRGRAVHYTIDVHVSHDGAHLVKVQPPARVYGKPGKG